MENFKKTYRKTYAEIETIHKEICELVKARNAARSAGDAVEADRIGGQIHERGKVLGEQIGAMISLLSQVGAADWRDCLAQFESWLYAVGRTAKAA